MKILSAAVVGIALTLLAAAPTVRADDRDDEVRYWSAIRGATVLESGVAVVPGTRIYYLADDPKYDLSGADETVYLVEDGSLYRAGSKGIPVTLVKASPGAHEVVAIPTEYRQNWMSVMAGDRPVRTVVPSRMVSTAVPTMIVVPSDRVFTADGRPIYFDERIRENGRRYQMSSTNGYRNGYRNGTYHKHHRTTTTTATKTSYKRTHRAKSTATTASTSRRNAYRNGYNTGYRNAMAEHHARSAEYNGVSAMKTAAARYAEEVRNQPDAYQIKNTWYRREAGGWTRAHSWRGPFVYVDRGSVPREVIESEKKGSKVGHTEVIGD